MPVDKPDRQEFNIQILIGLVKIYQNYVSILLDNQTDTLTGILNRKTFDDRIMKLIELKKRQKNGISSDSSERRHINSDRFWLGIFDIDDFKDYKIRFKKLCEKYWKDFNLTFDKKNTNEFYPISKNISEESFIKEVEKCKTERQLKWKYKKLDAYKNWITLKEYESWKSLLDKTYEIMWNIEPLLKYLQKNNYPHSDHWTGNSKYYYLAIQIWLKNINTKQETLNYLYNNSGYEWFKTIMYIYESLWDSEMCMKLFDRYLKFCDFIVY